MPSTYSTHYGSEHGGSIFDFLHLPESIKSKIISLTFGVFVLATPFSMALHSVALGLMGLWIILSFIDRQYRKSTLPKYDAILSWTFIPLVYLFSLFYSHDLERGWSLWLKMSPLLIIPVYLWLFQSYLTSATWIVRGFLIVSTVTVLLHFLANLGLSVWPARSIDPISLFYTPDKNGWIWWAALGLSIVSGKSWYRHLLIPVFVLGLLYVGELGLLLLAGLLLIGWKGDKKVSPDKDGLIKFLLVFPVVLLTGWIAFDSSHLALSVAYETVLSFYTKAALPASVSGYFQEIKYSIAQWWMHPFNGVGLGDYIHAMWNEYNTHGLQVPDTARQQFLQFMVSCGLVAVMAIVAIVKSYHTFQKSQMHLCIYLLVVFLFFMPLISTVAATAFMIPLLLHSMDQIKGRP